MQSKVQPTTTRKYTRSSVPSHVYPSYKPNFIYDISWDWILLFVKITTVKWWAVSTEHYAVAVLVLKTNTQPQPTSCPMFNGFKLLQIYIQPNNNHIFYAISSSLDIQTVRPRSDEDQSCIYLLKAMAGRITYGLLLCSCVHWIFVMK